MAFPAHCAVVPLCACLNADIAVLFQAFLDRPVMEVAYRQFPKV